MTKKELQELEKRVHFCQRTMKAFNAGILLVDGSHNTMSFIVREYDRERVYRTLEDLETFVERLVDDRRKNVHTYRRAMRDIGRRENAARWVS